MKRKPRFSNLKKNGDNVWNEKTVVFDKRYQVSATFFTVKKIPSRVDAALPNIIYEGILNIFNK